MFGSLAQVILASLLVGGSTLAHRLWGARTAGLVSALPAVVGPVLLITADDHGALFTARAANGTLLGLAALAAFVLVYARMASRAGWVASLLAGWLGAVLVAVPIGWAGGELGFPGGLVVASVSLWLAHRTLPNLPVRSIAPVDPPGGREILVRMALTAALVAGLAAAAGAFGPLVGGMLAALPVLASVLAVLTHRRYGAGAVVALLHGMLSGMAGFVGFCVVVAALVVPAGILTAFGLAALSAVGLQVVAHDPRRLASP